MIGKQLASSRNVGKLFLVIIKLHTEDLPFHCIHIVSSYVAVTGRKRTLFLSLFDHFLEFVLL